MSQTWDATAPDEDNDWDDDLPAMKNNFAALQSNFSGTAAPTSPVAGQGWTDTGSDTHKRRNANNDDWLADLHGDINFKIPVYRNDTCDGWIIDATVTDRVIALKGGSDAYNANGGTTAGTAWSTLALGHTHGAGSYAAASHRHTWYDNRGGSLDAQTFNSGGSATNITSIAHGSSLRIVVSSSVGGALNVDGYTNNSAPSLSGTSATGGATTEPRPAAALCTLQYPDFT